MDAKNIIIHTISEICVCTGIPRCCAGAVQPPWLYQQKHGMPSWQSITDVHGAVSSRRPFEVFWPAHHHQSRVWQAHCFRESEYVRNCSMRRLVVCTAAIEYRQSAGMLRCTTTEKARMCPYTLDSSMSDNMLIFAPPQGIHPQDVLRPLNFPLSP